jgi:DNA repair exonuclease SbcCD nuclease subunit
VADRGVTVVLVPANHERSSLPYPLLAAHRHLHVFDRPRTVRLALRGLDVAVAGFPCERDGVAASFVERVASCAAPDDADVRLLCLHQTVEGARVGPADFTFRPGPGVVPGRLIPAGFAAVLAGHIHRHQILTRDLAGRPLAAPVVYPGSVERTSFAELPEPKGFVLLEVGPDPARGGRLAGWRFVELPTRPMLRLEVDPQGLSADALAGRIAALLSTQPANAVVSLRLAGPPEPGAEPVLRVASLRRLQPATMVVTVQTRWGGA